MADRIDRGLHLDALALVGDPASLDAFDTTAWAHTSCRLLGRLGARERSRTLALRAFRARPRDPYAEHLYLTVVLQRRGPFAAWEAARRLAERRGVRTSDGVLEPWTSAHTPEALAPYRLYLAAEILLALRDFDGVSRVEAALAATVREGWAREVAARALHARDQRERALVIAKEALVDAGDLSALHLVIDLLRDLRRDEEARELLADRDARTQCGAVSARLGWLERARGAFEAADAAMDRAAARLPLAGEETTEALGGFRVALAYEADDLDRARAMASTLSSAACRSFVARVDALDDTARAARRVRLGVPFVVQHWMTCVPATLSALLEHQGMRVDQAEIADSICYDGTKPHAERAWAAARGLVMREFTVDLDVAVALLDRGIAFSLVLVSSMGAHMVAVVGYDLRLGLLLVHDPGHPDLVRVDGRALATCYGPRAAVVLTEERAPSLDGLDLPESDAYDALNTVHEALERGDVPTARERAVAMNEESRLRRWAERAIALHVDDFARAAAISEELLRADERDHRSRRILAGCLSNVILGADLDARLVALTDHPSPEVAPLFVARANLSLADARETHAARAQARRCLRAAPAAPDAILILARCAWLEGHLDDAFDLARVAVNVSPFDEDHALAMVRIGFAAGRRREALAVLRSRAELALARSGAPSVSLAETLVATHRVSEALGILDRALSARPEDRSLLSAAARLYASLGRRRQVREIARRLVGAGAPRAATVALLHEVEGRTGEALAWWRAELSKAPTSCWAALRIASLLSTSSSATELASFLRDAVRDAGGSVAMRRALAGFADAGDDEALDDSQPLELRDSASRLRVLARRSLARGELDAAGESAAAALALEPRSPAAWRIRADLARCRGAHSSFARLLRWTLTLDPDRADAIRDLVRAADTTAAAVAAVQWIASNLAARSAGCAGVDALVATARGLVDADVLLEAVEGVCEARPSSWLAAMAAAELRFAIGPREAAIEAARDVARAVPGDVDAVCRLAELELEGGDASAACALARRAYLLAPTAQCGLFLANVLFVAERTARAARLVGALYRRHPKDPRVVEAVLRRAEDVKATVDPATVFELLESRPMDLGLWYALAAHLGAKAGSLVLDRAVATSKERPRDARLKQVVSVLARSYHAWSIAIEHARAACDLLPSDATLVETLTLALVGAGRRREARAVARRAGRRGLDGLHARARVDELALADPAAARPDRDRARRRLERALRAHAGLHLARSALVADAERRDAHEDVLVLTRAGVKLTPWKESGLRRIAQRHLDARDLRRAAPVLARIHVLAPRDTRVACALLDAWLGLDAVPLTAQSVVGRVADAAVRARYSIQIFAALGEERKALAAFRAFGRLQPCPPAELERAVDVFTRRWSRQPLMVVLDDLVRDPATKGDLARPWAAIRDRLDPEGTHAFLLLAPPRVKPLAMAGVLSSRGIWSAFFLQNLFLIHRATPTWAEALRQWTKANRHLIAALWARGAARRADLRPDMLVDLATSFRVIGLHQRAIHTHELALRLTKDASTPRHCWSLALHAAFAGEYQGAMTLASRAGEGGAGEPLGEIRRWTKLLLDVYRRDDRVHGLDAEILAIEQNRRELEERGQWAADHRALLPEVIHERRRLGGNRWYRSREHRWLDTPSTTRTLALVLAALAFIGGVALVVLMKSRR